MEHTLLLLTPQLISHAHPISHTPQPPHTPLFQMVYYNLYVRTYSNYIMIIMKKSTKSTRVLRYWTIFVKLSTFEFITLIPQRKRVLRYNIKEGDFQPYIQNLPGVQARRQFFLQLMKMIIIYITTELAGWQFKSLIFDVFQVT